MIRIFRLQGLSCACESSLTVTPTLGVMTHLVYACIFVAMLMLPAASVASAPTPAPASPTVPALSPALLTSLQALGQLTVPEQQKLVIAAFVALNCTYPDPEEAKRLAFVRERCECFEIDLVMWCA
jgi:hypothetical protein